MIQFRAVGTGGGLLGIGLSFANLDRIQAGDPAFVLLTGERGRVVLAHAPSNLDLAVLITQYPDDHLIGLTSRTLETLRGGEAVEIPLARLGLSRFAAGILFAGPTEFEMVDNLRATGLVDAATKLEGLEEYLQHERNEVETCALCRERRHRKRDLPVPRESPQARTWQETLHAHPYLASLVLLGVFALLGLAVALLR